VALFESGLPARFYLPAENVRMDFIEPSEETRCAYKGVASYWHVRVGDTLHEDLAWAYPEPERDGQAIRDLICLFQRACRPRAGRPSPGAPGHPVVALTPLRYDIAFKSWIPAIASSRSAGGT
jgi:hypothetical protein